MAEVMVAVAVVRRWKEAVAMMVFPSLAVPRAGRATLELLSVSVVLVVVIVALMMVEQLQLPLSALQTLLSTSRLRTAVLFPASWTRPTLL